MKTIRFDYTLSNGINDCIYYDECFEIPWKEAIEDIQEIADEYEAEIVSIEQVNQDIR